MQFYARMELFEGRGWSNVVKGVRVEDRLTGS